MKKITNRVKKIWEESNNTAIAIVAVLGVVVFALGVAFGVCCLKAWIVMLLWNWVAVGLFGAPTLNFWLSFGLCWLISILLKNTVTTRKDREE